MEKSICHIEFSTSHLKKSGWHIEISTSHLENSGCHPEKATRRTIPKSSVLFLPRQDTQVFPYRPLASQAVQKSAKSSMLSATRAKQENSLSGKDAGLSFRILP